LKTPAERAAQYSEQQQEMYQKILDSFMEDQLSLDMPADFSEK